MEQRKAHLNKEKQERLQHYAQKPNTLAGSLAARAVLPYGVGRDAPVWELLTKLYGKDPLSLSTDEFLCRELQKTFATLVGKEMADKLPQLIALRMEGQFSISPWRRSYRSKHFSFYAEPVVKLLVELIRFSCYDEDIKEWLFCTQAGFDRFDMMVPNASQYLLALEIRQGNQEIIALLQDALLGEDPRILLTGDVISAIVISGHEGLLDSLVKLLLAAKLQEGVRQQILEAADKGSIQVLTRLLKVCLDNDLFRFSAGIRALDTWTGLGYTDAKPAAVRKYAQLAYDCLTDERKRAGCIGSENNAEAYFGLWALGCREITDTYDKAESLLRDPRHYRQILGWLFVTRSDSSLYQMHLASQFLDQRDEEVLAWVVANLAYTWALWGNNWQISGKTAGATPPNPALPESREARGKLFFQLKDVAAYIGSKKHTFSGNPFDFVSITLDVERVHSCMLSLAGYDMDKELISELLALAPNMTADQRLLLLRAFLKPETDQSHRSFLRACLGDRSLYVRKLAVEKLGKCTLTAEDMDVLAQGLRSKSGDLRSGILQVFKQQSPALLRPLLPQLLRSAEEAQNQAAIEMLGELKENHPEILAENRPLLEALAGAKLSTQTEILLRQLLPQQTQEVSYTPENGYGFYDPQVVESYLASLDAPVQKPGLLSRMFAGGSGLLTASQLKALLPSWKELDALLGRMNQVFERHANTEIEVALYDGSRRKLLFGDVGVNIPLPASCGCRSLKDPGARLDMVPFWDDFLDALGEYGQDPNKLLGLYQLSVRLHDHFPSGAQIVYSPWYAPIAALDLSPNYHDQSYEKYKRRYWQMLDIFQLLPTLLDPHTVFTAALQQYRSAIAIIGEENLGKLAMQAKAPPGIIHYGPLPQKIGMNHRTLMALRYAIRQLDLNAEDFSLWFSLEYRLESLAGFSAAHGLDTASYLRAYTENTAPRDVVVQFFMTADSDLPYKIRVLTNPTRYADGRKLYERYPLARELIPQVIDRIVAVEEKRGELATPLTRHCLAIERFEGAKHFCNLLAALGKESFFRGYEYSQNDTKKAVLSRLLKRCYPGREDTPKSLAAALKATDISPSRLVEAVMYAPQWAGFAQEILGWEGLKCGVWFFHAHINETFSAEKETEVAIFSPISPQQFNDGAFDKNWFLEAYSQLGEKRFQLLYKAAKYITSGSNQHRRSQLYCDAVLGRLDAGELMQEITEKRNQEKLRCYPLVPIGDGDSREALRRYEFIQKFLKESKQFGAQRRESEKKACATALENLAITTGLMDVNRLMWQMESQKIQELQPLMEPVTLDGVSLRLTIDANGDADIAMEKGGKPIKTLPKSLAKNETYLTLKTTVKELKELKRRSRESLERAMTECTCFEAQELTAICANPILAPMVKALVWTDGTHCGFLRQSGGSLTLAGPEGSVACADALRIAHPHDMKHSGTWPQFMTLLYEKALVQPFKQVFREYYPLTEDERQERTISRRYAGHQVQPQRTLALLKGRGWTVDYEEGLQKVFYKEDLVVRLFAMADWFSPAEIEAPTLETVEFFHRRTGENVALEDVPPVLFSETMRDLDLVVSVAHAGGVDPEASHSTVEMRTAIARELVKLLKLSNVSWVGSHAKIHGALASYSVHLGSGVVHAEGVGMVSILPVHSQARGRIFLPFADNDPKTAEIMSKILLLSEDKKLKDPTILAQLSR